MSNEIINYYSINKGFTKLIGDISNNLNVEIDKIRNRSYSEQP